MQKPKKFIVVMILMSLIFTGYINTERKPVIIHIACSFIGNEIKDMD